MSCNVHSSKRGGFETGRVVSVASRLIIAFCFARFPGCEISHLRLDAKFKHGYISTFIPSYPSWVLIVLHSCRQDVSCQSPVLT
jgi:hypothetical protein